ncbi:TPA: TIGR03752 family integrating conjugative element protein [Pasteurella multocida]
MKLKSNVILKILVPSVIAVAVLLGIKGFKSTPEETVKAADPNAYVVNNVTPEELRELNIQGDTAEDTVKTLLGETKNTKRTVQTAKQRIDEVLRENEKLRLHNDSVDERINEALEKQRDEMMSQFENELSNLTSRYEEKLAQLESKQPDFTGAGNGTQGVQTGNATTGENLPIGGGQNSLSDQTIWVLPDDMQAVDKDGKPVAEGQQGEGFSFAKVFSKLDESFVGKAHSDFVNKQPTTGVTEKKNPAIPVYTLPENSTLIGSVAMTALIGRIPLNGQVTDAYPFKILIGRENLTANGIDLPDVEGAVISGLASGDWTLSCVRGSVNSMTFVFSDGHTQTISHSKNSGSNNPSNSEGIGWISDPHGIPCVPGERKTNAAQFLAGQFLLSGSTAAAQGLSQGQTTTIVDGNSVIGAVTGNQGKFILGQALGGGLSETTEWFRQRYGQTFDAVYVPPGHQVAVHLTKSIDIDYDPNGRKVKYFTPIGKQGMD